jgi:hypothetical protein
LVSDFTSCYPIGIWQCCAGDHQAMRGLASENMMCSVCDNRRAAYMRKQPMPIIGKVAAKVKRPKKETVDSRQKLC